jgi:DNA-binding SARP family transcriptional activator
MHDDAGGAIRFEVLGPMRVTEGKLTQPVAGARQRVVLGVLLEHANQPVPAERLAEVVWEGAPPQAAVPTLRSYVMRLRRGLGPRAAARILTKDNGYLAQVEEHELDALSFEAQCRRTDAAAHAGDWPRVARAAEGALAEWRGEPLLDVPCRALQEIWLPRLEQLRLQASEWRIEAELRLGRNEQLIQPLRDLIAAHPLRERFHAQLMLALYRTGRQAEALAAYQDAHRVLVAALGIEPGPDLRSLHARMLAGEVEPSASPVRALVEDKPAREPASLVAGTVPRQLPATAKHFIGRRAELGELAGLLDETAEAVGTVVISAIDGMAGIGKTALAIHAAHRLAEKFPDGQLFIDLHGYTQGRPPRTADEALAWLLRALGVPPERIPRDGDEAAALYRQRLADSRTLIVLDNAVTEAQVRPLLPGAGSCLVLVTSRRRLMALDDAHIVALDLLAPPDAVALLRAVAGPDRIAPEDPLAGEIAELCGYLPLALRIAASLLRHRPSWPLEHLAGHLRDQRQRVAALSDGERELAAVFDLSYTSLDERHRRLWRRLGLVPGPDLDAHAAAALTESDPVIAAGMLENLVDHNLLIPHTPGRYRLHDLLRAHARILAAADPAPEREAVEVRLLHYYARTAQSASVLIARGPRPWPHDPAPAHTPALTTPELARTWLRTEQPNLDAAFTHARSRGLDEHAIALAAGLAEILQADGPFTRALEIHRGAAETAERLARPAARATALTDLARVRQVTGDSSGADEDLTVALQLYRALGHRLGEANALTDLGRVRYQSGDLTGAGDALTVALQLYRALGDLLGEANALTDLGRVHLLTGDYPGAIDVHVLALELYRALGHRLGEATALTDLGRVRFLSGDASAAAGAMTLGLELYRELGNRHGEATALLELGRVRRMIGDAVGAEDALSRALELFRVFGNRHGEATALTGLRHVRILMGDLPGAVDAMARALELYRALGHRMGEANGLSNLGRVLCLTGDYPGAIDAHTRALELDRALGSRSNEAWALNHYAAALAASGQRPRALETYQQALAMNRELHKPDDEAISLEGIAEHYLATGDPTRGTAYLREALEIYQRLGMAPDEHRVQEQLGGVTSR